MKWNIGVFILAAFTSICSIRDYIKRYPRFRLIENDQRVGFYHNFERALNNVPDECSFVALSDQDDFWYANKLTTLVLVIFCGQIHAEFIVRRGQNRHAPFVILVIFVIYVRDQFERTLIV